MSVRYELIRHRQRKFYRHTCSGTAHVIARCRHSARRLRQPPHDVSQLLLRVEDLLLHHQHVLLHHAIHRRGADLTRAAPPRGQKQVGVEQHEHDYRDPHPNLHRWRGTAHPGRDRCRECLRCYCRFRRIIARIADSTAGSCVLVLADVACVVRCHRRTVAGALPAAPLDTLPRPLALLRSADLEVLLRLGHPRGEASARLAGRRLLDLSLQHSLPRKRNIDAKLH
mmetsp:Transcript_14070/g.24940  ORF Transcript_14070/g.24940 Transcript_14070/m.24940 type:complete len:226 (-) Transcript_14070:531-1208(-)